MKQVLKSITIVVGICSFILYAYASKPEPICFDMNPPTSQICFDTLKLEIK